MSGSMPWKLSTLRWIPECDARADLYSTRTPPCLLVLPSMKVGDHCHQGFRLFVVSRPIPSRSAYSSSYRFRLPVFLPGSHLRTSVLIRVSHVFLCITGMQFFIILISLNSCCKVLAVCCVFSILWWLQNLKAFYLLWCMYLFSAFILLSGFILCSVQHYKLFVLLQFSGSSFMKGDGKQP